MSQIINIQCAEGGTKLLTMELPCICEDKIKVNFQLGEDESWTGYLGLDGEWTPSSLTKIRKATTARAFFAAKVAIESHLLKEYRRCFAALREGV